MDENKSKKQSLLTAVLSVIGCIAAGASKPMFLFFQNGGEAHIGDIAPTMLAFLGVGLAVFGLLLLITRNFAKSGLSAILFLVLILNYASIEKGIQLLFSTLRYWHLVPILLVVWLCAVWLIAKKLPDDLAAIITPVLSAMFVLLILINGVLAIPRIATRVRAERQAEAVLLHGPTEEGAERDLPNFYFILFDEFSTIPFMQKYYDYDNSELVEKLEDLGFNTSQTGDNRSNRTAVVTTDIFQMNYVSQPDDSTDQLFAIRSDNTVFSLLRDAGYTIISPAGADFYGLPDALSGSYSRKSTTVSGEDLKTLVLKSTILYPLQELQNDYPEQALEVRAQLDYLEDPSNFAEHEFILAHLELPHERFLFNADGSVTKNMADVHNWKDPGPYLNQYIFASNEMYKIAQTLVENDPDSVIWILSDHSARASSDSELYLKKFSMEDMTSFFSAVYYQGETLEIEGLSGVNTMRLLLNKLLGTNYEMIP